MSSSSAINKPAQKYNKLKTKCLFKTSLKGRVKLGDYHEESFMKQLISSVLFFSSFNINYISVVKKEDLKENR